MRIVLQRVREAAVHVDDEVVGRIGRGVLLLVGVARGDTGAEADVLVRRIAGLRIFPGRTPLDRTLADVGGGCLVVSQFTLLGSVRKGNRPGFGAAEAPAQAEALYEHVVRGLSAAGLETATGRFGAPMAVHMVGDGPVTLLLEAVGGKLLG